MQIRLTFLIVPLLLSSCALFNTEGEPINVINVGTSASSAIEACNMDSVCISNIVNIDNAVSHSPRLMKTEDLAYQLEFSRDAAINDGRKEFLHYYRDVYRKVVLQAYGAAIPSAPRLLANREPINFEKQAQIIINQPTDRIFYFNFDSNLFEFNPDALALIATHGKYLRHTNAKVMIAGFTDSVGSASYNIELGKLRAERVKRELIDYGVREDQISVVSYGSNYTPKVFDNDAEIALWRKTVLYY